MDTIAIHSYLDFSLDCVKSTTWNCSSGLQATFNKVMHLGLAMRQECEKEGMGWEVVINVFCWWCMFMFK